jgi:hypothetical protein
LGLLIGLVNFHAKEEKDKDAENLGCSITYAKDGDDFGIGHVEALSLAESEYYKSEESSIH